MLVYGIVKVRSTGRLCFISVCSTSDKFVIGKTVKMTMEIEEWFVAHPKLRRSSYIWEVNHTDADELVFDQEGKE